MTELASYRTQLMLRAFDLLGWSATVLISYDRSSQTRQMVILTAWLTMDSFVQPQFVHSAKRENPHRQSQWLLMTTIQQDILQPKI